jgi:hypothetical protein
MYTDVYNYIITYTHTQTCSLPDYARRVKRVVHERAHYRHRAIVLMLLILHFTFGIKKIKDTTPTIISIIKIIIM